MRTLRTTTMAGAIVFLELFAQKAMAAELQPLDLSRCIKIGKYRICPYFVPKLVLSEEQFEALQKTRPLTADDIKAVEKTLEKTPIPDLKE